jgi:Rad3-related DNA helicase
LQKVVQAVGRVIRSTEDSGVVHLMDDRFGQAAVRRLFPRWWRVAVWPPTAGTAPGQPMQVRFFPVRLAS